MRDRCFEISMVLLSVIYFLVFAIVGSIYLDTINETMCGYEKNIAEFCLFVTFLYVVISVGALCCLSPSPDRFVTISHHSEGICKDCGPVLIAVAFIFYIIMMVMSVEIYKQECSRQMGTILVIESFMPISTITFLFIFMLFYGCICNMKDNRVHPV